MSAVMVQDKIQNLTEPLDQKSLEIFMHNSHDVHSKTDRLFLWLLIGQWLFAIGLALVLSPFAWEGKARTIHLHVQLAVLLGGLLNTLPIMLILHRPGWVGTRYTIAVVQMLWSALLIHLTGGRIETHFHVFGSLAFIAMYRDWRVLVPATITVAADHFIRGILWPESVYGIVNPEWWRFLEHASWVIFEDLFLVIACLRSVEEMKKLAQREAKLDTDRAHVEQQVIRRTSELEASKEQYRTLLETTGTIVPWDWDAIASKCSYIGPQVRRVWGWKPEKFAERHFLINCTHPDDRALLAEAFNNVLASRNVALEHRIKKNDGEYSYVRSFLSYSVNKKACIRGISIDITVQKKLEAEINRQSKTTSEQANKTFDPNTTSIQFVSDSMDFVRDTMNQLATLMEKYESLRKAGNEETKENETV